MSTHSEPAVDSVIPTFDVRALARRAAIPAALAAVAAAALIVAGGPLHAFADALRRALDADPRWVGGAAVLELLSFAGYVLLLWMVGSRASGRMRLRESTEVTLGGAAATRLLPTGGVGGAALTVWALRRTGMTARAATRTLLSFLIILYSVFLAAITTSGALLALGIAHGNGPVALSAVPGAAAALGIAGSLALGARASQPGRGRILGAADVFGEAVRDAIGYVRTFDPRLLGAVAWWMFDGAVLWAMLHAFGAPPPFVVVVLAYFVGQVGNTIPIPGAVSGGMVGVLVAIWLPAPIGLVALGSLRRTIARWSTEDNGQVVEPAPPRIAVAGRPRTEPALQLAA